MATPEIKTKHTPTPECRNCEAVSSGQGRKHYCELHQPKETYHAPTPCHYVEVQDQKTGLIGYEIRLDDESVICEIKPRNYLVHVREANAAFIVRAVNNFEALLDFAKNARLELEKHGVLEYDRMYSQQDVEDLIAKAEGK